MCVGHLVAKQSFKSAFITVGIVFIGIPLTVALLLTPSEEEIERQAAERAADPTSGATYACREFVKANLVAPSSAEFGAWSQWPATELDSGAIEVIATVDAQNSFGAMIRSRFICELRKEDGQWFLENLTEAQ